MQRDRYKDYSIDRFMGQHLRGKAGAIIIPKSNKNSAVKNLKSKVKLLEEKNAALEARLNLLEQIIKEKL